MLGGATDPFWLKPYLWMMVAERTYVVDWADVVLVLAALRLVVH